jgi:hypothetical protein
MSCHFPSTPSLNKANVRLSADPATRVDPDRRQLGGSRAPPQAAKGGVEAVSVDCGGLRLNAARLGVRIGESRTDAEWRHDA